MNDAAAHDRFLNRLRAVIDRAARTTAGDEDLSSATVLLEEVATLLGTPRSINEDDLATGRAVASSPVLAPMDYRIDDGRLSGTVVFTPAFEGAGAVHGGHVAAVFDTILGRLATSVSRCRTASLTVEYRRLTPVGTSLEMRAEVARVVGRKMWLRGSLTSGSDVCAEATGLFLTVASW